MNELLHRAEAIGGWADVVLHIAMMLALCTVRLFVALSILPATSQEALQGAVRNGTCLLLGAYIAWGQPVSLIESLGIFQLVVMLLKEALLGLLIGFAMSVVFWVAEGIGKLIDNAAGFNNVQQVNPLSGQQSTPVGNMLAQLAYTGFYMLGGMMVCVGLIFESFAWWPPGSFGPSASGGIQSFLAVNVDSYFDATVKVATPLMVVLILIDLGFGLISRTAQALEPSSLSQPVKSIVAILMLAMLVSVFFDQARDSLMLHDLASKLRHWLGD